MLKKLFSTLLKHFLPHPFLKFEDGHYWVLLELTDDIIVARKWWRGGNHGEIIKKPIKSDFVGGY
ncbi:hypothetical protein KJ992_01785 [Patescibacteria group bacterium]|nr:hypothetical protein [Patescibacteria group bacterium]MBU1349564.1 hypothetical protein [Patescibacteria group bacterium]MBU1421333.1 hypothetical protein [Patescibacteria group bacterium]MBU1778368.1 hypothetical protein [Patescibacteria group bacterium]MBU2416260.1 hypothetical protein [Patescibacteria group bacterium]